MRPLCCFANAKEGAAPAEGWPGLRGLSRWVRRLDMLILPTRDDGLMKQFTGRPMLAEHHVAAIAVYGMALGIIVWCLLAAAVADHGLATRSTHPAPDGVLGLPAATAFSP